MVTKWAEAASVSSLPGETQEVLDRGKDTREAMIIAQYGLHGPTCTKITRRKLLGAV